MTFNILSFLKMGSEEERAEETGGEENTERGKK